MNAARCFSGAHAIVTVTKGTVVTSDCEACFDQGVVKVGKDIVTFNDEKDEDALVEEGPQIERGLVFHRDACHREIYQRNIRDKRLLHEVCFDLGDVKVGETHCDLQ